eukprot:TRINITY_DN77852_c0_g1_i1.p1 TRINITY_DN77852_c0_g1~~TRINITY_DN77852_c0_g1_i1.p1  ORF type:complete len:502 (-),score=52.57 TRINITY_DN77852_c0_g1_i1:64-1569(-)
MAVLSVRLASLRCGMVVVFVFIFFRDGAAEGATRGQGQAAKLVPLLGDGDDVDWWFAFKLNTKAFPTCTSNITCKFGGQPQSYRHSFGLQYLLSSSTSGQTSPLSLNTDCLGNGADPVAATFAQVYDANIPNYVLWNDQFYSDPKPDVHPSCSSYCTSPWGHSKGMMAWGEDGSGFVMQVSTPDWPGSGSANAPRQNRGNSLGCCNDDNVLVAQHFFALRLSGEDDTRTVLEALQRASVVTDPANEQIVKLTAGPDSLVKLAQSLGKPVLDDVTPYQGFVKTSEGKQIRVIAKPSRLEVPPWQMVSSLTGEALRTATWWASPKIASTKDGFLPGCWNSSLATPKEVQVATSGQWAGTSFSLEGKPSQDGNHAKIGHSLSGQSVVFGDMNQAGSLSPGDSDCKVSQNGRGGLFFVVEDETLHAGVQQLLKGDTAPYASDPPSPTPAPSTSCGGLHESFGACKERPECTYVYAKNAEKCGTAGYGCFKTQKIPAHCQDELMVI